MPSHADRAGWTGALRNQSLLRFHANRRLAMHTRQFGPSPKTLGATCWQVGQLMQLRST